MNRKPIDALTTAMQSAIHRSIIVIKQVDGKAIADA